MKATVKRYNPSKAQTVTQTTTPNPRPYFCDTCPYGYDAKTCDIVCIKLSEWHVNGHVPYDLLPALPITDPTVKAIRDSMPCDTCFCKHDCSILCQDYVAYLKRCDKYELETGRELNKRYPTAYTFEYDQY